MKKFVIFLLIFLGITASARAGCVYKGKTYPVGTVIGPLICMPDGTWQPKQGN